eukprot:5564758-Pyramimonas_sp.AAC.1
MATRSGGEVATRSTSREPRVRCEEPLRAPPSPKQPTDHPREEAEAEPPAAKQPKASETNTRRAQAHSDLRHRSQDAQRQRGAL